MLSFQFAKLVYQAAGMEEAGLFLSVIKRLAGCARSFLEQANSNAQRPQNFNIQNVVVSGVRNITSDVDIWRLHDSAKTYLDGLNDLIQSDQLPPKTKELVERLSSDTRSFLEHYKRHITARDYSTSFDLLLFAYDVYPRVEGLETAAMLVSENLKDMEVIQNGELEIVSSVLKAELSEYVGILVSLLKIYDEVSRLAGIDSHEEPLIIEKLETGSLYLRLKGAVNVIQIMTRVLRQALKYGAANHTISGRMDLNIKATRSIENVIVLRRTLKENGINVDGMDDEIESASLKIAKHSHNLVTRMSDVGLNGEVFETLDRLLLTFEEEDRPRLIGHDDRDDDVPKDG